MNNTRTHVDMDEKRKGKRRHRIVIIEFLIIIIRVFLKGKFDLSKRLRFTLSVFPGFDNKIKKAPFL